MALIIFASMFAVIGIVMLFWSAHEAYYGIEDDVDFLIYTSWNSEPEFDSVYIGDRTDAIRHAGCISNTMDVHVYDCRVERMIGTWKHGRFWKPLDK